MYWTKNRNVYVNILSLIAGITLGVGTLFLGLAAFFGASNILNIIDRIKDVNKSVVLLEDSVDMIGRQNNVIASYIVCNVQEEDKCDFEKLMKILNNESMFFGFYGDGSLEIGESQQEIKQDMFTTQKNEILNFLNSGK